MVAPGGVYFVKPHVVYGKVEVFYHFSLLAIFWPQVFYNFSMDFTVKYLRLHKLFDLKLDPIVMFSVIRILVVSGVGGKFDQLKEVLHSFS